MRRAISTTSILGLVLLVFIALSALMLNTGGGEANKTVRASELHVVERGGFDIRVPSSGELASEKQINIRNVLDTDAAIISVVEEGSFVQEGDILFELNDEQIKENIRSSEINVNSAKNDLLNAETALSISQKKQESELSVKELAVELASLALMAWREGEVVAKRQSLQLEKEVAEKNHSRLLKKYESSVKLYEQLFLSRDELDQDEISLLDASAALKKTLLDIEVYENYTFKQEKQKKESDLKQAGDELDRSTDRLASEIRQSASNLETRKNQLEKREEQLANRQLQLDNCKVVSPASGMVVYASSLGERREDQERLRVGLRLYKNQLVLVIPDTSNMIAVVKVNEALSGLVEVGQKAGVMCDAYPEAIFDGEVVAVGILAVGGGWRDPNRRDYTVEIKINNPSQVKLKPSMRCTSEIFIGEIKNKLYVPIHTIHRDGEFIWVWKKEDGGFAQHPIEIGKFSESFVVVNAGLEEGDVVLLREPAPSTVVSRLDLGDK